MPASRALKTVPWSNTSTMIAYTYKKCWTLSVWHPHNQDFIKYWRGPLNYVITHLSTSVVRLAIYPIWFQSHQKVNPCCASSQCQERSQRLFLHVFDMWSRFRHLTFVNLWNQSTPSSQTTKWSVVTRHVLKHFARKRISSLGRREISCCPSAVVPQTNFTRDWKT